jgi:hypothetical protein
MYFSIFSLSKYVSLTILQILLFCYILPPLFTASVTIALLSLSVSDKEETKDSFGGEGDAAFLMMLIFVCPLLPFLVLS